MKAIMLNNKNSIENIQNTIKNDFTFTLKSIYFDENYIPSKSTRRTTNFANLAIGENRQENLRNAINMMNNRFNTLANWDNPNNNRYSVELEIVSVDLDIDASGTTFPLIEILKTHIIDHKTGKHIEGIVGNNFSSYVRDYDFSIQLLEHNRGADHFSIPKNFGELHGNLRKRGLQVKT